MSSTLKEEGELIPSTLVVCLQIPDYIAKSLLESTPEIKLRHFSLLDTAKIESQLATAQAIFCVWDGVKGRIAPYIKVTKTSKSTRAIPIYLIVPEDKQAEAQDAKATGADAVLVFPKDSFRLPAIAYDLLHRDERAAAVVADTRDPGMDFVEKRYKDLSEIKAPRPIRDDELVKTVKESLAVLKRDQETLRTELENKNVFSFEPMIVFHPDEEGAAGLARRLRQFGCAEVIPVCSISDALALVSWKSIDTMFMWYGPEFRQSAKLLQELNEARELNRFAHVLMVPGEESEKGFISSHPGVLYDGILLPQRTSTEFHGRLQAIKQDMEKPEHLLSALFRLRLPSRQRRLGGQPEPMPAAQCDAAISLFLDKKEQDYWGKAEMVFQHIFHRRKDQAYQLAEELFAAYPNSLDPVFVLGHAKALKENTKSASEWMVDQLADHRAMNLEKCYFFGKLFVRWNATAALKRLLEAWIARSDLPLNDRFFYCLGTYHLLLKDDRLGAGYLRMAVKSSPLMPDYMLAYGRALLLSKNKSMALDVFRCCLGLPQVDPGALELTICSWFLEAGEKDIARERIATHVQKHGASAYAEKLLAAAAGV